MADDELVRKIVNSISRSTGRANLAGLSTNRNIVPGLVKIIKGAVGQNTAIKVMAQAPSGNIAKSLTQIIKNRTVISAPVAVAAVRQISQPNLGPTIFEIIKGAIGKDAAIAVVKDVPSSVISNSVSKIIKNNVIIPKEIQKAILTRIDENSPEGIALQARGATKSRNYSRLSIEQLLVAYKKYPSNSQLIIKEIYKRFDDEISDLRRRTSMERARRLGQLLRMLQKNFQGRGKATSLVVQDINSSENIYKLSNFVRRLGSVPNENVKRALQNAQKRLRVRPRAPANNFRFRTGTSRAPANNFRFRTGTARAPANNFRFRMGGNQGPANNFKFKFGGNQVPANNFKFKFGGNQPRPANTTNFRSALAGLPKGNWLGAILGKTTPTQNKVINASGGVQNVMKHVASVPEGPTEIAKAAEALHLTNGNKTEAVNIHQVSRPAVNAVVNLGGPKKAMNALNTLNEIVSPNPKSVNSHFLKPKYAALTRALHKIHKNNLSFLVKRKITGVKSNNKHLKKYYEMIVKSNILKTPAAKRARSAAKKRVGNAS